MNDNVSFDPNVLIQVIRHKGERTAVAEALIACGGDERAEQLAQGVEGLSWQ